MNKETKIFGASDDLLVFNGGIYGEIGCYNTSDEEPIKVKVSDGTEFEAYYNEDGLWRIKVLKKGTHYKQFTEAVDPDSDDYSDILILSEGNLTAEYKKEDGGEWESVT